MLHTMLLSILLILALPLIHYFYYMELQDHAPFHTSIYLCTAQMCTALHTLRASEQGLSHPILFSSTFSIQAVCRPEPWMQPASLCDAQLTKPIHSGPHIQFEQLSIVCRVIFDSSSILSWPFLLTPSFTQILGPLLLGPQDRRS